MDEDHVSSARNLTTASPGISTNPMMPTSQPSNSNLRMMSEASPSQPSRMQHDPFSSPTRSRPVADASLYGRGHSSRDQGISQLISGSPSRSPFWSPRQRVTYSDRCIPSRATSSRLDFSMLDREIVTAAVSNTAVTREVCALTWDQVLCKLECLGVVEGASLLAVAFQRFETQHCASPCRPSGRQSVGCLRLIVEGLSHSHL